MTEQQKNALSYVTAALSEYAATLAPSVRGPFIREAGTALKEIEAGLTPLTDSAKP
jgi:hypothetical protein